MDSGTECKSDHFIKITPASRLHHHLLLRPFPPSSSLTHSQVLPFSLSCSFAPPSLFPHAQSSHSLPHFQSLPSQISWSSTSPFSMVFSLPLHLLDPSILRHQILRIPPFPPHAVPFLSPFHILFLLFSSTMAPSFSPPHTVLPPALSSPLTDPSTHPHTLKVLPSSKPSPVALSLPNTFPAYSLPPFQLFYSRFNCCLGSRFHLSLCLSLCLICYLPLSLSLSRIFNTRIKAPAHWSTIPSPICMHTSPLPRSLSLYCLSLDLSLRSSFFFSLKSAIPVLLSSRPFRSHTITCTTSLLLSHSFHHLLTLSL